MSENIKQSISGRKKNKLIHPPLSFFKAVLLVLAFIFAVQANCSLAQAATAPTSPASPSSAATAPVAKPHYLLTVIWDSPNNTLSLKDGTNPELTMTSLTKDSGTGSQFYSLLVDTQGRFAISSKTKTPKYFLGKWELPSGQKQGEIKFTVPFLSTGAKIVIMDANTDKKALEVDVSKLSSSVSASTTKTKKAISAPVQENLQTPQVSNKSVIWGWVIMIITILILGGGGYWLYRFYKKRKDAKALEPPFGQNKI
jgi:hypothetical protein